MCSKLWVSIFFAIVFTLKEVDMVLLGTWCVDENGNECKTGCCTEVVGGRSIIYCCTVLETTIKVISGILITAISSTVTGLCVCCCVARYRKYRKRRVAPEQGEKHQAKPVIHFAKKWRSKIKKTHQPKKWTFALAEEKLIQPSEADSESLAGMARRVWFINKLMQRQNEMKESHQQEEKAVNVDV